MFGKMSVGVRMIATAAQDQQNQSKDSEMYTAVEVRGGQST